MSYEGNDTVENMNKRILLSMHGKNNNNNSNPSAHELSAANTRSSQLIDNNSNGGRMNNTQQGYDPDGLFKILRSKKNYTRNKGEVHTASLASPTVKTYNVVRKDGKLYLKTFLIDDSMNKLGWKMNSDSLDKYIQTAIGRPAILNNIHFHPIEFNNIQGDNAEPFIQAQEPYRVGTIRQIYQGSMPHTYDALIEITDPKLLQAHDRGELNLPKYVSPAVYSFNPNDTEIRDYEFLHLAFVDNPAYGTLKANVKGSCKNSEQICHDSLKQAAIERPSRCIFIPFNRMATMASMINRRRGLQ